MGFKELDIIVLIEIKIRLRKANNSIKHIKENGILNGTRMDFRICQQLLDPNIIDYMINIIDSMINKKIKNLTSKEELEQYESYIEIQYKIREEQVEEFNNNPEIKENENNHEMIVENSKKAKELIIELDEYEEYLNTFKNTVKEPNEATNILSFEKLNIIELITIKIKLEKMIYGARHIKGSGILLNRDTNQQSIDFEIDHYLLDVEVFDYCIKTIDEEIIKRINTAPLEELKQCKHYIEDRFKERNEEKELDTTTPFKMQKTKIENEIEDKAFEKYATYINNRQRKS